MSLKLAFFFHVQLAGINRPIALAEANAVLSRIDLLCEVNGSSDFFFPAPCDHNFVFVLTCLHSNKNYNLGSHIISISFFS